MKKKLLLLLVVCAISCAACTTQKRCKGKGNWYNNKNVSCVDTIINNEYEPPY